MKALILGAGYGTRLQKGLQQLSPEQRAQYALLIEGKPKPLLPIASKPLIEFLLEKIEKETDIQDVYVVCNNFFYSQFEEWANGLNSRAIVHIVNDGSNSNEKRLGVIGDIVYSIQHGGIDDDLFVLAGDTLYDLHFGELKQFFYKCGHSVIGVYEVKAELLHRRGVVITNEKGRVIQFLEKPKDSPTKLASPIAYILTREAVLQLPDALQDGYNPEMNTIEWLIKKKNTEIYTFRFERRWDVGMIEDYIAVNEDFQRMRA